MSYRLENLEPVASQFRYTAVTCGGCSAPIGVLDYHNTGEQLKHLQAKLDRIETMLNALAQGH